MEPRAGVAMIATRCSSLLPTPVDDAEVAIPDPIVVFL
jgi:hypothetical protein